jgi:hypothetical protein
MVPIVRKVNRVEIKYILLFEIETPSLKYPNREATMLALTKITIRS